MEKSRRIKLTAPQILVLGVIASIFIGAILLKLPISNGSGKHIKFIDSLFTATSAVCVTGLNTSRTIYNIWKNSSNVFNRNRWNRIYELYSTITIINAKKNRTIRA